MRRKINKEKNSIDKVTKPYVQFSKKIITFCILNLIVIELFVMYMIFDTKDSSVLPYLITSLAVQFLGCVVWYLKNSEAEKKSRINAEVERMKIVGSTIIEEMNNSESLDEPDTYYKETKSEDSSVSLPLPSVTSYNKYRDSVNAEESESLDTDDDFMFIDINNSNDNSDGSVG